MRRSLICAALLPLLAGPSPAGDLREDGKYDFFGLARYPEGGKLVEGVDLYEVKEGGGPADEYTRRVVDWWPRKGVDVIEVQDGMILRQWRRKADMLVQDVDEPGKPEVHEHERLMLKDKGSARYLRRIRGYLHPPADGTYVFKISANTMALFFVSTDEEPGNRKPVCSVTRYTRNRQWDRYPGQISAPIPLKGGRKYYYEVVHRKTPGSEGGDHVEAAWEGTDMAEQIVGGENVSTLDGEHGKVIEERWKTTSGSGIRPRDLPRTFKAHLMGFDGIGNPVGDPFKGEEFVAPTVVLRMPDGTKRSIDGNTFCQADRKFIMHIYMQEMKRIRAGLDKTKYKVRPGTLREYPGEAEIGEPGTMLVESEHFVVPSGSQDGGQGRWINPEEPEKAARLRKCVMTMFEHFHAYLEYGGHLMPYWDRKEPYKYEVHVGGTIADGYRGVGGGAGGGYGGQGMGFVTSMPGGFGHEYGHGFSIQWNAAHSGEILATANMDITGASIRCDNNVARPYRNCLHASYNTTLFYRMIGFDPNWGHCAMTAVPAAGDDGSFFGTIARLGQQRGMFKHGIRGVGDTVGDFGARLAEFDTQIREGLRKKYFAVARNYLEPVDKKQGIYRIPWGEAPEPFGVNIIRLVPDEGGKAIEVDFRGYHDPAVYSDWRACIVAVDKNGKARYSDLWNKGRMTMPRRDGDRRYWLTVAATPRALYAGGGCTNRFFQGTNAPRYPWQVTLRGAAPGRPQRTRADLDDVYCAYGVQQPAGTVLPAIPDTAMGRRFVKEARAVLADMKKRKDEAKGQVEKINIMLVLARLNRALGAADGAPHPNGGGWVATTAEAAPTAYVGPNAAVLGRAKVLDHAVVEDYAVVRDSAVVSDHARVSGQAVLAKETHFGGYKRAWFSMRQSDEEDLPALSAPTDEYGLLANYAMDQDEAMMLESLYRNERGSREFFDPVLNGYLYGGPEFVVEDEHRGFAFNGKTQYAELNRRVADLAKITVDMALKWQGKGEQTLLDFGSGKDNRFVLTTAGKGGKPAFTAIVDGKPVSALSASRPLPRNRWTRLRLEIDGERIALWLNEKKAGQTASAFRPCQAFEPGVAKRNVIAAARDGGKKFKGVFDNVVIYTKVHGESFAEVPPPILDAPRRPEKGFAMRVWRNMEMSPFERADRSSRCAQKIMGRISTVAARGAARQYRLKHRSPGWEKALERAREIEAWKKEQNQKISEQFDATQEAKELNAQIAELDKKIATLKEKFETLKKEREDKQEEPPEPTEEEVKLRKEVEALTARLETLQKVEADARAAVAAMPQTKADEKEIARLKEQIKPLDEKAKAMLKEALDNDKMAELFRKTGEGSVALYWRVARARGDALGGALGARKDIFRQRLKAEDPEFRKWAELNERVEELQARRKYRLYEYILKHTDHPMLLGGERGRGGEIAEVQRELRGKEQALKRAREESRRVPLGEEAAALQEKVSALQAEKQSLRSRLNNLKQEYMAKKTREAGLPEREKKRHEIIQQARKKAVKPYYQEDIAIQCMLRQGFHGFYNAGYHSPVRHYCARLVGGSRVRDNLGRVQQTAEAYAKDKHWKTSVDRWEWRTRWEIDGSIKDLPLTRKWLKRVRGAVEEKKD